MKQREEGDEKETMVRMTQPFLQDGSDYVSGGTPSLLIITLQPKWGQRETSYLSNNTTSDKHQNFLILKEENREEKANVCFVKQIKRLKLEFIHVFFFVFGGLKWNLLKWLRFLTWTDVNESELNPAGGEGQPYNQCFFLKKRFRDNWFPDSEADWLFDAAIMLINHDCRSGGCPEKKKRFHCLVSASRQLCFQLDGCHLLTWRKQTGFFKKSVLYLTKKSQTRMLMNSSSNIRMEKLKKQLRSELNLQFPLLKGKRKRSQVLGKLKA